MSERVHLPGKLEQRERTRCGRLPPRIGPVFKVTADLSAVTCRMCRRCAHVDAGNKEPGP